MFQHDRTREATPSIRGYVYQAYQTVLAWLNLTEQEALYLERGEDFDIELGDEVALVQVKNLTAGSVTLRSPDVLEAIKNYWLHAERNEDRSVYLRFLTTALAGIERGSPFGHDIKGIEYWNNVAKELVSPEPMRSFLLTLELGDNLSEFIRKSDDAALSARLFRRIKWDVGSRPKEGIEAAIKAHLVEIGYRLGERPLIAERVIDPMLRRVADLMSTPGVRKLVRSDAPPDLR